ncbi:MAG: hypothetical protein ABI685_01335 [Ferruginibacter sp.]
MQKLLLLICLAAGSLQSFSQKEVLLKFEKDRAGYTKKSMMVLGGWSAANIIVSGFATKTHNREMRYFHQMNVQFNAINLVFAGLGYWGADKQNVSNSTLLSVMKHQNTTEKTYVFNTALDLAYIAGGLYMTERSKSRTDPAKLKGYGNAIMVQGGFLFLYDAANYLIHHKHGKQLDGLVQKLELAGGPGSVSMVYTF